MQTDKLNLKGVQLFTPAVYEDERGYFFESFSYNKFCKAINDTSITWVQENQSCSEYGVFRGMHFQKPPHAQAKLITCVSGSIVDFVLDLRTDSETYGKWCSVHLSESNKNSLFIPMGCAHGFVATGYNQYNIIQYKCSEYYNKESEASIKWSDATIGIKEFIENMLCFKLNRTNIIVSKKDIWSGLSFEEYKLNPIF